MNNSDLPNLRRVALSGAIRYTAHAMDQMLSRGIFTSDVESVLCSNTNQLIEIQSPSNALGKQHNEERDLIYDPDHIPEIIVVIVLQFSPSVGILVVTAEYPEEDKWTRNTGKNPGLTRK